MSDVVDIFCKARFQTGSDRTKEPTVLTMHRIEGTLSAYAGTSALDAAQKPVNRQWAPENSDVFGGRQVGLM